VAININLTPERSVEELVFRKRLAFWALTTGRTIIIVTECVVLVVFLARFYFDKKIFDLASSIEQKSVILEQKADFEKEFRKTQAKADYLKFIVKNSFDYKGKVDILQKSTPDGVFVTQIQIGNRTASYTAQTSDILNFGALVENFLRETRVSSVTLKEADFLKEGSKYSFSVEATFQ